MPWPDKSLSFIINQLSLSTLKETIGFEALVRWNHPELGLLSPVKFIPVAETTGLIVPLGWLVLREACRQMHQWNQNLPNASSLFVSVNMSSKQFAQKNVFEKIRSILDESPATGRKLKVRTDGKYFDCSLRIHHCAARSHSQYGHKTVYR